MNYFVNEWVIELRFMGKNGNFIQCLKTKSTTQSSTKSEGD